MKNVIKVISLGVLTLLSLTTNAATINGSFGIIGELNATGAGLASVTDINLATVLGSGGSDGDTSNVTFFLPGTGGSTESLAGPWTGNNFFTIAGWDFSLSSLNIVDQTSTLLTLEGTGVLSGNKYEATAATWTFSTSSIDSYSMSITAVPVPAAIWLFGSGLIGLVAVSRRKA